MTTINKSSNKKTIRATRLYVNGKFLLKEITGVQRFAREIVRELLLSGADVVLLCPSREIKFDDIITPDRIVIVNGGKGNFWEQITLPLYLRKNKIKNLINLCNTAPFFYKRNTIVLHDVIFKRYPGSYPLLMRLFYESFVKWSCKRAHLLLTVSNFSRKEISEVFKIPEKSIGIIPNAVPSIFSKKTLTTNPIEIKHLDKEPGLFKFIVLGSFDQNKNLQTLVSAFKLLNNNQARLLLLGNHTQKQPTLLSKALEDPRIKYIGRVSDEELKFYYQNAWYYIIPSRLEGFGIPPLEAQFFGCPVISSNTSSLPEVLGESAIYFNPDEINSIKDALELSISNFDLRKEMILKAKKNILRFDFSRSAKILIDQINKSYQYDIKY